MRETCFRDRGIDRLCVKRASEIGALIEVPVASPPIILSCSWVDEGSFIKWGLLALCFPPSPISPPLYTVALSCLPLLPLMFKSAWITWSVH